MRNLNLDRLPILLFFLSFPVFYSGYAQSCKFFDTNNGLSSSLINKIVQDSDGYIWIATEDGLNRFDGTYFTVYRNIPGDTTSLPDNYVRCILEDREKRLWITTMTGLCLYDGTTGRFKPYSIPSRDTSQPVNQPLFLMEDRKGNLWISTSGSGTIRMDADNQQITYFETTNSDICSNHINRIYEDRHGNLWFCSGREGLSIYNPANGLFRTFRAEPGNKNALSSDIISSICEDNEGNVWVGTLEGGLNIYSFATRSFRRMELPVTESSKEIGSLMKDREDDLWIGTMGEGFLKYSGREKKFIPQSLQTPAVNLSRSKVQTMYEDRQGNIWMGLFQKGLFLIPKTTSLFVNHTFNPFSQQQQIGTEAVQPILVDSHEQLWISTDGDGVYRFDQGWTNRVHYKKGSDRPLPGNIIVALYEDALQNIWLGTYLNGAIRYNRRKDAFDLRLTQGEKPFHLLSNHVTDLKEDAAGRLWIATNGGGINIYDPLTRSFEYLTQSYLDNDSTGLIHNWCNLLCFDKDSLLWIATYGGLCTYDKKRNTFTHYNRKNGWLPNDIVIALEEDSKGNMWIGTQDGLVRINKKEQTRCVFTTSNGLPNNIIKGVKEDADGTIWISTNFGLSAYRPESGVFTNYTTADGLITNELNRNSFFRNKDNQFFVGSMKGLTTFYPSDIRRHISEPLNLVFTNLYIFNERVEVGHSPSGVLTRTVNHTDKIELTHEQNSFSLEFTALEFMFPEKVNYAVRMKGFDNKWRKPKNKMVTYTNLNPGRYTLLVKAWINDESDALTKEIQIETLAPFWATPLAKTIYLLLAGILGYGVFRYGKDRMNVKRQEQLMQAKLQFFTDISHEIRTPLTLILSPLGKLISQNTDASLMQTYHTMYKNSVRLLQLVNQIMDLRALEFGKKKLYVEETDVTSFVRDLKNSFHTLAEEKGLVYTFTSQPEKITGFIDTDIVTKILFNLISNAIKYTEAGTISVTVETGPKQKLVLSVEDTGKGISPDQQTLIFERFYMIDTGKRTSGNNTGIGLHLTRKLTELHHGTISLRSEPGKGSRFQVTIPSRKEDYSPEERGASHGKNVSSPDTPVFTGRLPETKAKPASGATFADRRAILVVEDNEDIRRLLFSVFGNDYLILEASDGKEGLRLAMEKRPELIISDLLMPEMDGAELCKKIRNNENTRSIPFVMLTSRSSMQQQIEGLKQGADAYIAKPFDIDYLRATVDRLVASRRELKKTYREASADAGQSSQPSAKDKQLRKLNEIIDRYLDDPNLNVDILCRELGLSRTHLNRKVKELTGDSPASYIRQIRLQKSARLLKTGSLNISEIAFRVGFSSPSYFSQAFRDYYGITPKEYMEMENEL